MKGTEPEWSNSQILNFAPLNLIIKKMYSGAAELFRPYAHAVCIFLLYFYAIHAISST